MKTPKKAKCGIHSLSFCNNKHDAPQCEDCILVKHNNHLYKYINGKKYKYCPHCKQYYPMDMFYKNSQGHISWCINCKKEYAASYHRKNKKSFMIGYKDNNGMRKFIKVDSAGKMIKLVREHMINNNESVLEIKRL